MAPHDQQIVSSRERSRAPARRLRVGAAARALLYLRNEPIRFRRATARYAGGLGTHERRRLLGRLVADNAAALLAAVERCVANGAGAFRVDSEILPLSTHPKLGYVLEQLDLHGEIHDAFATAAARVRQSGLRLSLRR